MTPFTNGKGVRHTTTRGGRPLCYRAFALASAKQKTLKKRNERSRAAIHAFPPLLHNTGSPVPEPRALRHREKQGSRSPVLAVLCWQPCADSSVLAVLFRLSCSACPLLPVHFCLSSSSCSVLPSAYPVLPILFCLSCSAVLFWLSSPFGPALSVFPSSPVVAALF